MSDLHARRLTQRPADSRLHCRHCGRAPGPRRVGTSVHFQVWAPEHRRLEIVFLRRDPALYGRDGRPLDPKRAMLASYAMDAAGDGWFHATFEGPPRLLYQFRVDGEGPYPDPASRSQPFGVHGPSEIAADWPPSESEIPLSRTRTPLGTFSGVPLEQLVIYEVHVGTATPEGTFDALAARLPHVRALGATAIELMPLASFPGRRNWGYDGVSLFAPQASYGGPAGLRRLIDAAHREGLGVLIDVVYNHFGPEGNYLHCYSKSFFDLHKKTPWGDAIDHSNPSVREFFLANAAMWIGDYRADGLRLDATHAIDESSGASFLQQVAERARAAGAGRRVLVIAEDERNERRLVLPVAKGGSGLDAVWADDFHHQMRRALAGDDEGYYRDYSGTANDVALTQQKGWFYEGAKSIHRNQSRGTPAAGIEPPRFVHCLQNHDQVGNRAFGDRLTASVEPAPYKAASAILLLSPHTPLLFMGQEWAASTPFLYFTDFEEPLASAVREGRRAEFAAFRAFREQGTQSIPDPQSSWTFERSRLHWDERRQPDKAAMLAFYTELLRLRRHHPALQRAGREHCSISAIGNHAIALIRRGFASELLLIANWKGPLTYEVEGRWKRLLSSEDPRFGGTDKIHFDEREARFESPGALILER